MASPQRRCVIFNPAGGRGRTRTLIAALRPLAPAEWEFRTTDRAGHAEEIARQAADEGFACVAAAGGDGTVHEVTAGLLMSGRPEVVFAVLPCGSANDYAYSLGWPAVKSPAQFFAPVPRPTVAVDVGRVTAPGGRSRTFVNCLGLGFNGAVTVEARKIGWLRGLPLYATAILQAMRRHFDRIPMTVMFDDLRRDWPTLALSVNLGIREGNFPLTPAAKLNDGWFDTVHAGELSRWELLKHLPAMATGKLPTDHPRLKLDRCRAVTVVAERPFRIHLDGEFFCHPEDGVREISVELLPQRLLVEQYGDTAPGVLPC